MIKNSQFRENDPAYVAEEIAKIVRVIISRMSIESQNRARINIKNRTLKMNPNEISQKKVPSGASRGPSIALIKNILNGRDGFFVRQVIETLATLL